ncbi:MAG: FAD-dependent monooxygenase [Streptosporangiaceae bacterium]
MRRIEVIGGGPAGLFAARLLKQRCPAAAVRVSERTVPDGTFGFGVAFTQRTLRVVRDCDRPVFDAIVAASVIMPGQEMRVGGRSVRATAPTGGIAIARSQLLAVLLAAARDAGVEVDLGCERGLADVAGADLVVAADGARSAIRTAWAGHFGPCVEPGRGMFMWLGCDTRLDSNLFAPVFTEHGMFNIHAYPYAEDRSTIGVEADLATWRRAGMDVMTEQTPAAESDETSIAYLQQAFGPVLGGARLLGNRSRWMHFPVVTTRRWHHGNVVLVGDAAHTAHYSVGSGTKMALEDAIVLAERITQTAGADGSLAGALAGYEALRRPRVEALQVTALRSQWWWESLATRVELPPARLMLAYLSRAGVVQAARLRDREPQLLAEGLTAYAGTAPAPADLDDVTGWVLSRPFAGRGLSAASRMWSSAADGRAGRAGVATVDGDVSDPWGAAADELVARCQRLAGQGVRVVRLAGDGSREALVDRAAVGERIVNETHLVVVAVGHDGQADDLADALIARRAHLVEITREGVSA